MSPWKSKLISQVPGKPVVPGGLAAPGVQRSAGLVNFIKIIIEVVLKVWLVRNQISDIVVFFSLTSATNITAHLQATAAAQSGQPPSNATSSDAQSTGTSCGAQTQAPNTPQQQSSQTASAQDSTRTTDTEKMGKLMGIYF